MARIVYINKEKHAEKVLELFHAKREKFLKFVDDRLSKGVSADETTIDLRQEVKAEMKRAIFEHLKRSGAVRGEYQHLYSGGYYRRIRREPRMADVPSNLLDVEKILPDFRELVSGIVDEVVKRRMIEQIQATTLNYRYDTVWFFEEGLAIVTKDNKCGLVDKTGREVCPLRYDHINIFSLGMAHVGRDGKQGYIDRTGHEVIPCQFFLLDGYYKGDPLLAQREAGGKQGYVDKTGREVIPFKYDDAYSFHDGMAKVRVGDKYGFIDLAGREVIPCQFEKALNFWNGVVAVRLADRQMWIDKTGREVPKPEKR